MDGVRAEELRYAQQMADKLDLDEGEDATDAEIRVRCSKTMKDLVEGLAKAETRARELRTRAGKVSVNKLMKLIVERYGAAWSAENKTAPPKSADDDEGVERAARAINARRAREGRAKT